MAQRRETTSSLSSPNPMPHLGSQGDLGCHGNAYVGGVERIGAEGECLDRGSASSPHTPGGCCRGKGEMEEEEDSKERGKGDLGKFTMHITITQHTSFHIH